MRTTILTTRATLTLLVFSTILSFTLAVVAQSPKTRTSGKSTGGQQIMKTLPSDLPDVKGNKSDQVTLTLPTTTHTTTYGRIQAGDITLKSESASVPDDADVSSLLRAWGITPDANSLGTIYDLNPEIDNLRLIQPGTVLVLPKVEWGPGFLAAKKRRVLVKLTKDSTWLQAINEQNLEMPKLSKRVQTLPPARFERVDDQNRMVKSIEEAHGSLAVILENRFPTSQKVLRQSALEAHAVRSIVERNIASNGKIPSTNVDQVGRLSKGLKEREEDLKNGGSGSGRVEVHTVKKSDGTPVPRLRVFYAPKLNLEDFNKYNVPSTPTTEALVVGADLVLWAGDSDDPTPVSDKVEVTPKTKDNKPVTLQVKEK